jgi:hypothetical protein
MKTRTGKAQPMAFRLYDADIKRLRLVQDLLEEKTGRPASINRAVIYLLDCHEDMRRVDEAVKAEMEVNRLHVNNGAKGKGPRKNAKVDQ